MTKLTWTTVQRKVNDLVPQEVNPRKISDKQMKDLTKSLKKYNLVEIPAVDLDGKILAGHQRIKALQLLGRGEEIIDVRIPNRKLTEDESKQYLISSNALGGDWDLDLLKSFDLDLLLDSGFDSLELAKFWDEEKDAKEDKFDVEKELKKITHPVTKLGDVIHLGNHKIICGDSTKQETLTKLFGNEKASMIYSDPVYNISVNYSGGIGGKADYGGNVNDTRTFDEYKTFISDSLKSALTVAHDNTHCFYYCDQIFIGLIQEVYRSLGLENKRVCLWLKNSQNPVPKVFCNKAYEPAVYAVRGRPYLAESITDLNEVMNKEFTTGNDLISQVDDFLEIWTSKRLASKNYEHATSKPISLHEKAIKRCTKPNDIILDSFLGSGSTLLAGEQLGRRVYGCELEPRFCDLIVKRYESLTGKKAVYEKE
ncbi:MAG: DNA modification methylase [Candidatus Pacebacteria bacterium]|nr:DNA modification methylase [Candidatus Paceibacterota bacterium]